jgi:hypothetical protein
VSCPPAGSGTCTALGYSVQPGSIDLTLILHDIPIS